MDELIKAHMIFCCILENQHEGLTKFAMTNRLKQLESKCEKLYYSNKFIDFTLALANLKEYWFGCVNKYTQGGLNL